MAEKGQIRIALAGNPNCGKTTMFNNITGAKQHVGNYAGVTVEKKEGHTNFNGQELLFIDLPGTYSLTARSLDELVARNVIVNDNPDVIVNVLDASNLERNLYLAAQLLELEKPMVIALNMSDVAEEMGIKYDLKKMAELTGATIVSTVGRTNIGTKDLLEATISVAASQKAPGVTVNYGDLLEGKITELVTALKSATKLPIQIHTHYTSGVASMTYMKAVEAGADVIDTAMSPLAMGTSQPATEVMVETFKGTPYDTGLDMKLLGEIADYFRPIQEEALKSGRINPKVMGVNIKTLMYQVPGGMLSNLVSQLKEAGAEDKYYQVLEEVPRVRKDFGEPPLVTPSSQIVGTQAVLNVLQGERYKMMTKESKKILRGEFGQTVKPFNKEVQKKAIGDEKPITCRPADLIKPQLDNFRKEAAQYIQQDEDVLTYALFPQVATDFFKYREAQQTKVDPVAADTKNKAYPV